jgi:Ethanolamine utilization protein EutJ (predicted chaperonin)
MLNLGRITTFRYGMREIMSHYEIDEATSSSLIASVIAKGSRMSISSARDYVRDQEKTGMYPKAVTDEICDLLEKFARYR